MPASNSNDLISAIYAATLSPRDFDKTLDTLDDLLFVDTADGAPPVHATGTGASRSYDDILPHIELAHSIQQRVGRDKTRENRQAAILEAVPNPSWLIDRSGRVLAANQLAFDRPGEPAVTLDDCLADIDARQRVHGFASGRNPAPDSEDLLIVAGYADVGRNSETSILVKRVAGDLLESGAEDCFLLTVVDFGFDRRVTELFRDAYALTDAEAQVAVLLATGLSRTDIAARRGVSPETVNTQIKTIKHKTSVRDIPALVRLLCGFSAGLLAPSDARARSAWKGEAEALKTWHKFVLPDGRQMEYLEQGAANGRPVLLLHNNPYGAELPLAAIRRAHRDNLRFIAPFRPGNRDSDVVRCADDDAYVEQVARDTEALLTHLGIDRVLVVSHTLGAAYALRFSRLFPDRVSSLIGVSRAPIWRDEWLKLTPRRQRFALRVARYLPQLLPVIAWSVITFMERGSARDFIIDACKDGRADTEALANAETLDLIAQGSIDGLRKSMESFCRDNIVGVTDYTAEAKVTPHKFHILHGSDDRIVDIVQSRTFANEVPGTELEVVEGAGQLLFYSHWPRVFDAINVKLGKKVLHAVGA